MVWNLVVEKDKVFLVFGKQKFNTSNNSLKQNQALVSKLNTTKQPHWEDNQGYGFDVYTGKKGTRLFYTRYVESEDTYMVFIG